MSDARRVLLVGATGLVGGEVLRWAGRVPDLRLTALTRRAVPLAGNAEQMVEEPSSWPAAIASIAPDAVICALGTTWRKAGRNERAFRAVDQDLVLATAGAARQAGARRMVLVSSIGADAAASTFYLRVKGEVEAALGSLCFDRLDILHPGLLRGQRSGDRRLLERLGILASPLTDRLLRGSRRSYRSISASTVAAAALQALREPGSGQFVHENDGILHLAHSLENAG